MGTLPNDGSPDVDRPAPTVSLPVLAVCMGEWRDHAACRQQSNINFFPDEKNAKAVNNAKSVCQGCPMIYDCLYWALASEEKYGIWGGHTERERRRMLRTTHWRSRLLPMLRFRPARASVA